MAGVVQLALRRHTGRRGGDEGVALLIVSLLLVALLASTAIVIDLGNARQQNRQANAASDAGALAGATSITALNQNLNPASCRGLDGNPVLATQMGVRCSAAYYASQSAKRALNGAPAGCTLESVQPLLGEVCAQYTAGDATIDVKYPYVLPGQAAADARYVHVKMCWDTQTTFARVIGQNTVHVCGNATAQNTGVAATPKNPNVIDCYSHDDFADANDDPTIWVFKSFGDFNRDDFPAKATTAPISNKFVLAAQFHSVSGINLSSIVFKAPTKSHPNGQVDANGNTVYDTLTRAPSNKSIDDAAVKGVSYQVYSFDNKGKPHLPYNGETDGVIAYELPDKAMADFTATLHVEDNANNTQPPSSCGNASWTKTTAVNTGAGHSTSDENNVCNAEDLFHPAAVDTVWTFKSYGDFSGPGGSFNSAKATTANLQKNFVLAAEFTVKDGGIDLGSITFNAPDKTPGNGDTLSAGDPKKSIDDAAMKGVSYQVYGLDATNHLTLPYNGENHGVIAYKLPDPIPASFTATLHVDAAKGGGCGNAEWDLNTQAASSCGEDSFLGLGQYPDNKKASPGDPVGAYYNDESPLQSLDNTNPYWDTQTDNFGIIFTISGPGFGSGTLIPPSSTPGNIDATDGYTLTGFTPPSGGHNEKYSTRIQWHLPPADDQRWVNNETYTITLKAFDTDQNKAGHDCGQAKWSFVLTGATGSVSLIE